MSPRFCQLVARCGGVRRRFTRRCACGVLLAMYVVTAAGVPLPAGNMSLKSGEMFPCMDCPCGCNSAEQCWRSCCCHTLAERMDWAREHGVRPPEYAIDEARRQGIDLCWLDDPANSSIACKTCCLATAGHGKPCCCCHHDDTMNDTATAPHCCSERHQHATSDAANRIVVWKALACGGQSMNWLAAVPTLIAVRFDFTDRLPLVTWLGPRISACADWIADEPVVPPPERA
jgi:hypothetical protein